MKTMKWLVRREFWEHKGALLWAPIVAGGLMVSLFAFGVIMALSRSPGDIVRVNGEVVSNTQGLGFGDLFNKLPAKEQANIMDMIGTGYVAAAAPLFLMLAVIAFFYCLSALHDERRDRSILFWKSLPVSDAQTVISKALTAALVAPLITIAVGVFISLLMLLIAGVSVAFHGINVFGPLLSNAQFYLTPLQVLSLLPVYVLFALPTIGWLMMVSAWAKSKVFLWAVGAPLLAMAVVKWFDYLLNLGINMEWVSHNILGRGLFGLVPGAWMALEKVNPQLMLDATNQHVALGGVVTQSYMALANPGVWIGAAAGIAMLYAATRLRRWKDEG